MKKLNKIVLICSLILLVSGCEPAGQTKLLIAERYADNGDGTVTDIQTNLTWQRCSVGYVWKGYCAEWETPLFWEDALALERDGWRLPTLEELETLVWCSSGERKPSVRPKGRYERETNGECIGDYESPVINHRAFPDKNIGNFWSSNTVASDEKRVWTVSFSEGQVLDRSKKIYKQKTRLVRNTKAPVSANDIEKNITYSHVEQGIFCAEQNNNECAFAEFQQAAERGDVLAQRLVAVAYLSGTGVERDAVKASKWFQKAANQGDIYAEYKLGLMYRDGVGVKQDKEQALELLQKAADKNYSEAQFDLGLLYINDKDIKKDSAKALKWMQKSAEGGFGKAQAVLGDMYLRGSGVTQDYAKAAEWLQKAAFHGSGIVNPYSSWQLGEMYLQGIGIAQNYDKAELWLRLAAVDGFPDAQSSYGTMYENGWGVEINDALAVEWYQKAAAQGDERGQWLLNKFFSEGRGAKLANTERYKDNNNGSVTDIKTNLIWQRCSVGQTWTGQTCTGEAATFNWNDAIQLAKDGWRLPTVDELNTLVFCSSGQRKISDHKEGKYSADSDGSCQNGFAQPAINSFIFPNVPDNPILFWSSTQTNAASDAWYVSFFAGSIEHRGKHHKLRVRLVRAGQ